jgi:hypothetical protein
MALPYRLLSSHALEEGDRSTKQTLLLHLPVVASSPRGRLGRARHLSCNVTCGRHRERAVELLQRECIVAALHTEPPASSALAPARAVRVAPDPVLDRRSTCRSTQQHHIKRRATEQQQPQQQQQQQQPQQPQQRRRRRDDDDRQTHRQIDRQTDSNTDNDNSDCMVTGHNRNQSASEVTTLLKSAVQAYGKQFCK